MSLEKIKQECFQKLEELSLIDKDSKKDTNLLEKNIVKEILDVYLNSAFQLGRLDTLTSKSIH